MIFDGPKVSKKFQPIENKEVSFCTWCFKGEVCVCACACVCVMFFTVCF